MRLNTIINIKNANRAKLVGVIVIITLFIFLLPGFMFSAVPKALPVSAENGYIDIAGQWENSDAQGNDEIYMLEGVWEYYPNQLLNPSDFTGSDTPSPLYAAFPHAWKDEPERFHNASGYATYRLVGTVPGTSDGIGFYSRFQFGAYKVFLNGIEVLEIGKVSENPQEYYISYQSSNAYLCPADSGTFEIILQIQNYDHISSGFSGSIFIGDMIHMKYFVEFLLILNGIMIGFLLLLLCYFLTVYIKNTEKMLYLNFAVVTLMSLYITMATCNEAIIYSVVPVVNPHILFKLEYITQIILVLFSTQYVIVKYIKSKTYRYASIALFATITAVAAVAPSMEISKLRIPFQVICAAYSVVPTIVTFKAGFIKKSGTAVWEFMSMLVLILGIGSAKLGLVLWNCVDLSPIIMTVFCFIQVVVLLNYYSSVELKTNELIELTHKAEAATIAKSDFLAKMSHEIRTPMNAIVGMSDLIDTSNFNNMQKLYFQDIKNVSHSLLNIINDILDFSKIESGKYEITPIHFNFYSFIDNICSMSHFSATSKDLRFESDIDITIPSVLFGDETRIRQVVLNLINNAVKYTHDGGIKLSATSLDDGKEILFAISDTGIGIKDEDIPRLFTLFEQLDREKNRTVMGTGLGLAICKQLTELMGGRVAVKSEYGAGSTFSVYLPLVEGDLSLVETATVAKQVYAKGADVLVVDDNAVNITVAKGILATHNINPDSARSGREAIEMVRRKDYDIIFMDHMMPEMDGLETVTVIRALGGRYLEMPIVALTANAVSGTRELLLGGGMTDFISKPIDRIMLNNVLSKWLPPEKLSTEAETLEQDSAETSESDTDGQNFLSDLRKISDLNVEKGLYHSGDNADTYKAILKRLLYETPNYIEELKRYLTKGDLKNYAIIVHGIKGSLYSIGAETLGDWAYRLEMSANESDEEICRAQTEEFSETILAFVKKLDTLIQNHCADSEPQKEQATIEQLYETLERLKTVCMLGDCMAVDEIIVNLRRFCFGEPYDSSVEEIITLAENMDYEKVAQKINDILR